MVGDSFLTVFKNVQTNQPTLNFLETSWAAYYQWFDNDTLATGLFAFFLHEFVYFGRALPWAFIETIPYFDKYKIQQSRRISKQEQWECTKQVLLSHFSVELPQIWLFLPMCKAVGLQYDENFPSIGKLIWQTLVFMVLEDTWHFWAHLAMHTGPLYRHIHKLHHKYSAPFGLAAEYAHPLETLVLGIGTIGPPMLYCYLTKGDLHLVTMYFWVCIKLLQAIDAHSGYDFPWSLNKIIPFWSGADHHDYHHMTSMNNYATSFRWWDYLLGTDLKYRAWKNQTESERAMPQKKIN